jgi:hypothetical protein
MDPAQIALQKALIRQLQSILGSYKGMLSAWKPTSRVRKSGLRTRSCPPSPVRQVNWRQ